MKKSYDGSSVTGGQLADPQVELLAGVMSESADPVMVTDPEGNIVWVNGAFAGVTEYDLSEVMGKNPRMLKSGLNSPTVYEDLWKTIKAGNKWRGTVCNRKKSGRLYLEKQRIIPIRSRGGEPVNFVSIKKEVLEVTNADPHVRSHPDSLDTVIEAVIYANDELRVTLWNKGAERIYGWKSAEVLGRRITDIFLNDLSVAQLRGRTKTIREKGELRELVYAKTKYGRRLLVERIVTMRRGAGNRETGYIGLHKPVTGDYGVLPDRTDAANPIMSILDSVSEGALLVGRDCRILYCNESAARRMSISAEQVSGSRITGLKYWPAQITSRWQDMLDDVLQVGSLRRSDDSFMTAGGLKVVRSTCFPLENEEGRRVMAGIVFQEADSNVEGVVKGIGSAEGSAAGKMAAALTHEIRTPLNSIRMNLDFLDGVLKIPSSRRKSFDIVRREVARLSDIVNDVLQLAAPGTGNIGPVPVRAVVGDTGTLFKSILAEKNITFDNNVEDAEITANAGRLESVFAHLIENSIDAIGNGGTIEISSRRDPERGELAILVADSGCGVTAPGKIFEPFFTTKKNGTGLGLFVAKDVLARFGAVIELVSGNPGQTIFRITFKS